MAVFKKINLYSRNSYFMYNSGKRKTLNSFYSVNIVLLTFINFKITSEGFCKSVAFLTARFLATHENKRFLNW